MQMTAEKFVEAVHAFFTNKLSLMTAFSDGHYEMPIRFIRVNVDRVHVACNGKDETHIVIGDCETKVVVKGTKVSWKCFHRATEHMNTLGLKYMANDVALMSFMVNMAFDHFADVDVVKE